VATVVYSPAALRYLERTIRLLAARDPRAASDAVEAIRSAIDLLAAHPLIGRRLRADLRELIISYGRTGYVALYRFVPGRGEVRVLALRHQREVGYRD
jgi:plasmid stabilization system protein ParE